MTDFEKITDFNNLYKAYKKAKAGKGYQHSSAKFQMMALYGVHRLKELLETRTYKVSDYSQFYVYEPKKRLIEAAVFKDKIIQHSLCDNVLLPRLKDEFIRNNFAGQKGKGTLFGLNTLKDDMLRFYHQYGMDGYILKADVTKFFYTIDHNILKSTIRKYFDDNGVLWLCDQIIDSTPNPGLPLGNQTSQVFALLYLNELDHYIMEDLQIQFYGRYMDDFYLFHPNKEYLKECLRRIEDNVSSLKLSLNGKTQIMPFKQGIKFLGFHTYVKNGEIICKVRNENKRNAYQKYTKMARLVKDEKLSRKKFDECVTSYKAHVAFGDCEGIVKNLDERIKAILNNNTIKMIKGDKTMGKFGKKVSVSTNINDYMVGIMAPSGFGKTTLMYQICEKEFGSDGYIVLDMGTEDGVSAIEGVVAESVPTWKKMKEVVDDIVKNKDTDYADLKVIVLDTLDATFEIAETYTIDAWNRENISKKDFTKSTSINSVEGGFGKGMDRVIDTVKKEITRLEKVGVKTYWTSHVKEKDQSDLFTGANYTSLTANMPMKYFNSIKNSSHVIGFGYFDRSIEKQEVGDANPMTKKKKERKAVIDETRKIKFRDDALVADAKSRFKYIIDEINLDCDEFIQAIKDAIEAERKNGGTTPATTKKTSTKKTVKKSEPIVEEEEDELMEQLKAVVAKVEDETIVEEADDIDDDEMPFDLEEAVDEDAIITLDEDRLNTIRDAFKASDATIKAEVKKHLVNYGKKLSAEMKICDVNAIEEILGLNDEV